MGNKRGRSLSPSTPGSKKRRASPIGWLARRKSFEVHTTDIKANEVYVQLKDDWYSPKTPTKDESEKVSIKVDKSQSR